MASQPCYPGIVSGQVIGIGPTAAAGSDLRAFHRDALIVLWDASDRLYSKRLLAMIPFLFPALERHGRLELSADERLLVLKVSAATIDRLLTDVKIAAAGGRRRRAGFSSAVRRQVPVRTFNDWGSSPPGYCEVDLVAHGGMSVVRRVHSDANNGGCRNGVDRILSAHPA
ncbi:hypothetical protein [Bradyrhizobium sp. Ec3.3]|uniref:hypothetical protein n=1 Tax=Bradyrhizobium sp. Ec3.3 TaxID=189753 RepID=UPI00047F9AD8|nr:hypothetical protein [Bradyrhizobium sp. Ec3.3]